MPRRRLLLAALLIAGCKLFKFDVSTPETRRQEAEALARAQEQERTAAETRQKVAAAEQAEAERARDQAVLDELAAAEAELAAGVSEARAIAFAAKVRAADGSVPARDGRLDIPKLYASAAEHLARVEPATPAAFTELSTIPRSPAVDAAVLRTCPRVRPAIPKDGVAGFVDACLAAAGGDGKQLKWSGVKADLVVHRQALDAERKTE